MRLNPDAFNALLANVGQRYQWRRSYACPCVKPSSGAAKPGCPQCGGRGRIWDVPLDGVAGMAGGKAQRQWTQMGSFENGDVVVTIGSDSPMYDMAMLDRMTALDNTDGFSVPLVRGQGDRLFGRTVEVTRVFWLDQAGAIVEGGLPSVSDTGVLTWLSGEPPAGMQYSITGSRYAEFFCFGEFPSDRNQHQGEELPRRVVLRKFDLFSRSGNTA